MDYLQFYTQYELWIIGAITALLTSIVCYFVAHSNIKNYQNILVEKNKSLCELEAKDKEQNTDILVLQSENSKLVKEKVELHAENVHILDRNDELRQDITRLHENMQTLQAQVLKLQTQNTELSTQAREKELSFKEQLQLLQDNKAALKTEFENLSTQILDKKTESFKSTNAEAMKHLLSPMQSELKAFKEKVETIHNQETAQRASLKNELENLQKLNTQITDQAQKLTTALKGEKKVQGNWGELMLENILDNAGLRLGKDYKREVTLTGEDGKFRPDAVVYLPQDKHLVIDAKTSFNAYTTYVNSEDPHIRQEALAEHVKAVRARLTELSDKDYFKLEEINSPEVVVMFLPIESAYVEALKADEQLFQLALDKNILIATPTTLLTSLNIVRQLWRFEEQNKHTAELASRAEKFYAKLNTFLGSMDAVGKQLEKAQDTYAKAYGQLYSGKANLIKQAAEFKDLGVSVQKELPEAVVEKANLELGSNALDESAGEHLAHENIIEHDTAHKLENDAEGV
jgi:DNA recombination protein RmuC